MKVVIIAFSSCNSSKSVSFWLHVILSYSQLQEASDWNITSGDSYPSPQDLSQYAQNYLLDFSH